MTRSKNFLSRLPDWSFLTYLPWIQKRWGAFQKIGRTSVNEWSESSGSKNVSRSQAPPNSCSVPSTRLTWLSEDFVSLFYRMFMQMAINTEGTHALYMPQGICIQYHTLHSMFFLVTQALRSVTNGSPKYTVTRLWRGAGQLVYSNSHGYAGGI